MPRRRSLASPGAFGYGNVAPELSLLSRKGGTDPDSRSHTTSDSKDLWITHNANPSIAS